jgi:imidazolonepropionase-like amidohydrolase
VKRFIKQGTTLIEIKVGSGLDFKLISELLKILLDLKDKYSKKIDIVSSYHIGEVIPAKYTNDIDDYVGEICEHDIPHLR